MDTKWMRAVRDWNKLYFQAFLCLALLALFLSFAFYCNPGSWLVESTCPHQELLPDSLELLLVLADYLELSPTLPADAIVIIIYAWLILRIRKSNRGYTLNGNNGFKYLHEHAYWEYLAAYYVLGVEKCKLIRVPIPMQFKVILQSPFTQYSYTEETHDREEEPNSNISIFYKGKLGPEDYEMNLVLSDTYRIDLQKQLPKAVAVRKTLYISRSSEDKTRVHSRKFVESVLNEVRKLPESVDELHIFATMNPWNTYEIVNEVFKTGGRDSIGRLYVYYQSSKGERCFNESEQIDLK